MTTSPTMLRSGVCLGVVLALCAAGCATGSDARPIYQCNDGGQGRCTPNDALSIAVMFAAVAVVAGGYLAVTQHGHGAAAPAATVPLLVGRLRWQTSSSTAPIPEATVTLRSAEGELLSTVSDQEGWFRFPLPRKPAWYTVTVDEGIGQGETTVWLQNRPPADLELGVRPRATFAK
jgi:hypothetical protein